MSNDRLSRRRILKLGAGAAAVAGLAGCGPIGKSDGVLDILGQAEKLTERVQRFILSSGQLAREFSESDISPYFLANGSTDPQEPGYRAHAAEGFASWRLEIGGLVERPTSYSLDELRAMPSRTQITRHDCVEGWSCIGKWKGVKLSHLLEQTGIAANARYVVFHCADALEQTMDGSGQYYESIAMVDAFHPQTILAYEMNDETLPIPYGAPVRLRLERQLGYKMAKYIMRIELVESFAQIGRGRGGFWEDRGYEWYAGI
ncbi:MAG: molybdopterin-binding protein [Salinarimonadaceae bacterium]|nr:MAG: molybdopterin-binding protein [Salinarimonadaceae bacterium]